MNIRLSFLILFLSITKSYAECNLVHLHVNKTIFFVEESIAFKTYVFNPLEQKAVLKKRNVIVELLDVNGNMIFKKKILYTPTTGYSIFNLKPDLKEGLYYLSASLETKSGGGCGNNYLQEITISNRTKEDRGFYYAKNLSGSNEETQGGSLDFKILLPNESLYANLINSVGFYVKSRYGRKNRVVVNLKNKMDSIIRTSRANNLGFGSFSFVPKKNEKYFLEVFVGDSVLLKRLPPPRERTFLLDVVKNYSTETISVSLQHNLIPKEEHFPEELFLRVKKSALIEKKKIRLGEKSNEMGVVYKMDELPNGPVHFVLEDPTGRIIHEQLVLNIRKTKKVGIDLIEKNDDSIELSFKPEKSKWNIERVFSVSVLPHTSKSVAGRKNIIFSFFLNHLAELNLSEKFFGYDGQEPTQIASLDILHKGMQKTISNLFSDYKTNLHYTYGFDLVGFVNNLEKRNCQIVLQSIKTGLFEIADLQKNGTFSFKNIEVSKGQEISLFLVDDSGLIVSNNEKIHSNLVATGKSNSLKQPNWKKASTNPNVLNISRNDFLISGNYNQIDLEEVVVTGSKLKYEGLLSKEFYGRKIDSTTSGFSLETLIKTYGYRTAYIPPSAATKPERDGLVLIKSTASGRILFPTIIYNGRYYRNVNAILNTPANLIEEIYYKSGGPKDGGTFIIFGKERISEKSVKKQILTDGFDSQNDYEFPPYSSFESALFEYYGQLYWNPSVTEKKNGFYSIKFPHRQFDKYRIVVEGVDELGNLYYLNSIIEFN